MLSFAGRASRTDKDNPDTDGDGLSDNEETYLLSTNPLAVDSDGNGVSDADEDFDHDTLTNIQELRLGSSPIDVDSDDDKLLDKEEPEYGTSLTDPDTDHDGISDYDEVKLGLSPLTADDVNGKFTTSFSADKMIADYDPAVIPTVTLTGDLECISSFKMELYDNTQIISPNVPGYVGKAYSFTTNKPFDSVNVSFALDMDKIEVGEEFEFDPVLYWLNEETQMLEEVPNQTRNGNVIEASLEHFSTYVVLSRQEFTSRWFTTYSISEDDFYSGELTEKKSKKDVLFLIDQSGSMRTSDTNNIKTHIMDDFVASISNKDRISVVGFNHEKIDYSGFESNKKDIRAALDELEKAGNSGGTNIGIALEGCYSVFANDPKDTYQAIFLISDGASSDSPSDELLKNYKTKGVRIFTVGIGSLSQKAQNELDRIATKTGGQYYGVKQSSSLGSTLIEFEKKVSVDKDKNKDGIEDYYEYLMGTGELTTTTNKYIFFGMYDDIMTKGKDFDDDGLTTSEEIEIVFSNGNPKVLVKTNPIFCDTDGDDYLDGEEIKMGTDPLTKEDIIKNADYRKVGETMAAGVASNDYIGSNPLAMLGERFVDVYICGGKFTYYQIDDIVDSVTLYHNAAVGEQFITLFEMLSDAGDKDVRNAAQYVVEGLKGGWESVKNTLIDVTCNASKAFGVYFAHCKLAGLGPVGIAVEVGLLITSLIVGDACSVRVTNSINVGLAQEIDAAISRAYPIPHMGYNNEGEMIAAFTVEDIGDYTNLFIFDVFAKCYAEREYLRYLNQDRWLIYKTDSSRSDATLNINALNKMICKYCLRDIPLSKQTDVK